MNTLFYSTCSSRNTQLFGLLCICTWKHHRFGFRTFYKSKKENKKLSGFPCISIAINIHICMFSLAFFPCVDKSLKTACWLPMDLFWIWCELMSLGIFDVWFTTTCREENCILVLQSNKTKQLGLRSVNSCMVAGYFPSRVSGFSSCKVTCTVRIFSM